MLTPGSHQRLNALKQRVGFAAWHNRNKLGVELFLKGFFAEAADLPGWQVQRTHLLRQPQWPIATRVLWHAPASSPLDGLVPEAMPTRHMAASGPLLHLDLFECASRLLAHEFLIELLGEFELPGMELQEGAQAGDVHFGHADKQVALFARANLALLLRHAGRAYLPIGELAATLDRCLIRRPDAPLTLAGPRGADRRPPLQKIGVGDKIPLSLPSVVPQSEVLSRSATAEAARIGPMIKVFADGGELLEENGQLMYHAKSPGAQEVAVYAIYPPGVTTVKDFRFSAEQG